MKRDLLVADEIERQRDVSPSERARQALDQMRFGIRLQRVALRQRYPSEPAAAIEERLHRWLMQDE
jgi:hypothetical protein